MTVKHHDDFGDRMKGYERTFTAERLDTSKPVYARLDGRSFSKFTSKMKRPFDAAMSKTMIDTLEYLVKETKANRDYTQSDEISLIWYPFTNENSQFMFDGKIQKLASVLAGMCSAKFVMAFKEHFGEDPHRIPSFDCRILNVPDDTEAENMLLWRMKDAFKNAVQSAAHNEFGHKALMGVDTAAKIKMLKDSGIDFFEFPPFFRLGTSMEFVSKSIDLTKEELSLIPEKHRPTGPVLRSVVEHSYPFHVEKKYLWEKSN